MFESWARLKTCYDVVPFATLHLSPPREPLPPFTATALSTSYPVATCLRLKVDQSLPQVKALDPHFLTK